ncbi:MAG TPA: hypothetical protein VIY48_01265 [Candidatus Paceibacterota bacterium]
MTVRFYSSIAQQTTLTGTYSPSATVIAVAATTGFPSSTPYTLALDYGTASEELVEVTNVAGLSLTVTRAIDGTSATTHNAGAIVRHVSSARDFADSRAHENASQNVHGIAVGSSVVGTTDTQTLTNKTLTSPVITGTVSLASPSITGTVTGGATYTGITMTNNPVVTGNMDVNGTAAGTAQLDVMAAAGQTASIQRWLSSGGATLASVTNTGLFNAASGLTVAPLTAANTAAFIKGAASQTGLLLDIQSSTAVDLLNVDAGGQLNALSGATLVGPPSPSTGGVTLKAGPSSIHIAEYRNTSNTQVADVTIAGVAQFQDYDALSAVPWTKITNTASIPWTTSTGLHTPSYGDATMTYMYKIVLGQLHFSMLLTFGSTTNFGAGATTADNWQFAIIPGANLAQTDFRAVAVPVGFGRASVSANATCPLIVRVDSTGGNFMLDTAGGYQDGTALTNAGTIDSLSPGTWVSGSSLQYSGVVPVTPSL